MQPSTLLALLIGAALAAGGLLQGLQWRRGAEAASGAELRQRVRSLESEVELLQRENESLRSLAQGGGEVHVAPALIGFVENALDLEFLSSPVVHRIAPEELRQRVSASIESEFPPNGLDHREQAWRLMGLLSENDRYAGQLAATRSLGARSWFDPQTGEAWVTDRFDEQSVPDQGALVRALARVLIHQNNPPAPGYRGDEAERANQALRHGAAIAIENRFLARQAIGIGFTGTQDESGAAELLTSLPPFIQGLSTFPSRRGTPRAERLIEMGELLDALHRPPAATAWFFLDDPPAAAGPPPESSAGGEAVLTESAGMLGLEAWLLTIDPDLDREALAWRSDRYQLHARPGNRLDLRWDIELSSEEAATEIADLAAAMAGALAGSDQDPAPGETLVSPEERRLSVTRPDPLRVRFHNLAPE